MGRGVGSIWCLVLLIPGLLPGCWSQGSHTVVLNGYRHNSILTSGDSVPLGTQIILVCQVVGLPYGTPLNYTWTCPNGPCEVEGYYGRKVYNEHILAVNTTSMSDGGTYTCQVTPTGGQEASGHFTLGVTGGRVVHSYGRLIPHEFPITDLQQISGPDGIGRIICTVSSGRANFVVNSGGRLGTRGVSQTRNGATATLVVNPSKVNSFQNRQLYCTNINTNFLFLFISSANPLSIPSLTIDKVTNSAVQYQVQRSDDLPNAPLIAGYEVIRFGVPMIGEYVNANTRRRVTISPAVPGAQYRITAWALGDGRRSATPAVEDATTGEADPSSPKSLSITRDFQDGIELNWLAPTEPNGEMHYVIYYTPEGGTEQSNDTGSNLTHYNLTGLERNRVYTNIAVQAVNSVGRSERSAVIAIPDDASEGSSPQPASNTTNATVAFFSQPTDKPNTTDDASGRSSAQPASNTTAAVAGGVVAILVLVLLALVGGIVAVVVVVVKKRKMKKTGHPHSQAYLQDTIQDEEGHKDKINMYQNVQLKPTPTPGNSEPYYSTVPDKFANPASATASFSANTYDEGGLYEDTGVDASRGGGGCKDKPVKGAQPASALLAKKGYELMHPEDFYAQPDKMAKVKKANQSSKIEETPAPVEDLYTMPDMTKMKQKNQKSLEQESEKKKLPPQAPLPYKKHKEAKEEAEEDVSELPPAYDFDGEQDCGTRDGDGSERRFEYAVLDWQKK